MPRAGAVEMGMRWALRLRARTRARRTIKVKAERR